jgi:hypothetical protein
MTGLRASGGHRAAHPRRRARSRRITDGIDLLKWQPLIMKFTGTSSVVTRPVILAGGVGHAAAAA